MNSKTNGQPQVVSVEEWQEARTALLEQEKAVTRLRDDLNAARRRMPMYEVEKDYIFCSTSGGHSLLDLFEGRRQLIVYHFMFAPDAKAGCEGCSWVRDAMTHPAHLTARDTSLVMVSRAPIARLVEYQQRMQWNTRIPWYSSLDSDFNYDFDATSEHGEEHGVSVFLRDGNKIFRTYYLGDRGVEYLGTQWSYLDLTPYGRQETWENSPSDWPQSAPYKWCRRHDEY